MIETTTPDTGHETTLPEDFDFAAELGEMISDALVDLDVASGRAATAA